MGKVKQTKKVKYKVKKSKAKNCPVCGRFMKKG